MQAENVDILNVKGEGNFPSEIEALKTVTGFNQVEVLGIVRDAKTNNSNVDAENQDAAFKSTIKDLEKIGIKFSDDKNSHKNKFSSTLIDSGRNIQVGIFISPIMLESLFWNTILEREPPIAKCVDGFLKCANASQEELLKRKIQIYLSAKKELVNRVGLGVQKGYFDFEANALQPLKEFLMCLKQAD